LHDGERIFVNQKRAQPKLRGKGPVDAPKKRLTEPHDAAQHKVLVKLLGDEEAKDEKPLQGKSLGDNDPRFEAGQSD
jgi:hypothetical protein